MKLKTKKIIGVSTFFCGIIAVTNFVFAASFNSTYDMTGGLFTRTFSPTSSKPIVTVQTWPDVGVYGQSMSVYLQKKNTFGYDDVSSGSLDSTVYDETSLKGNSKGTYRIYLRNWTGKKMSGDIPISY